jgi:hypothetical protein
MGKLATRSGRWTDFVTRWIGCGCALALLDGTATIARAQGQGDAGASISSQATAKEVGLPVYPGAKPHKDKSDDSPSAKLGLWGSAFGFKLVVLKMETNDAPEKVAAFYQKAAGKYGTVLNCSNPSDAQKDEDQDKSSKKLTCGGEKPEHNGMLFKSGTKEKQHMVGIQPNDKGSIFQLLYLEARGSEKDKQAL